MGSWNMLKKGKIADGIFHAAKHLNPLSFSFSLVDKLGKWMGGSFGRGVSKVAGGLLKATHFAIDLTKKVLVAPGKAVTKGLESLSNAIFGKKATKMIKAAVKKVGKAIIKGVGAVGKAVFGAVKGIVKGVGKVFKDVGKGFKNVGKAIGKGVKKVGKAIGRVFKGW